MRDPSDGEDQQSQAPRPDKATVLREQLQSGHLVPMTPAAFQVDAESPPATDQHGQITVDVNPPDDLYGSRDAAMTGRVSAATKAHAQLIFRMWVACRHR